MNHKRSYILAAALVTGLTACNTKSTTTTADTTKRIATVTKTDSTHLLGMWLDEEIKTEKGEQVAYQIVTQGPKTFIQVITFKDKKLNVNDNPEIGPSALTVKKKANNRYTDDNGGIYVIEKAGDLLIYDQTGFIAKCKKLL